DDDGFIDASTLVVEGEDVRKAERISRQPDASTNKGPVRLTAGAVSGSNYEPGPRHNVVPSDSKPASTLFDQVSSSQGTQGHQEPQQSKTTTDSKPSIAADSADDDGFIDAPTLVVEGEDVRKAERISHQPDASTNKGPVRLTAGAVSGSNYEPGPRHNVVPSDSKPASTLFDQVSSSQGTQGHQEPQQSKATTDSKPSIAADSADDGGFINDPARLDAHAVSVEHNSGEKIHKLDPEFEISSRKRDFSVPVGSEITREIYTTKAESKIDNHVGRFRTELIIPIDSRTAVRKERESQKVSILKEANGQKTLSYSNHDDKVILSVGSWSNSKNRLSQPTIHSVNMQNLARQKMQDKQMEGTSGLHIIGGFAFHIADETKFNRLYE
uniref:hypothetical protein n=1 Tax=Vibrio tetraodonis TaxID=2231647 RepID=UPI0013B379DC